MNFMRFQSDLTWKLRTEDLTQELQKFPWQWRWLFGRSNIFVLFVWVEGARGRCNVSYIGRQNLCGFEGHMLVKCLWDAAFLSASSSIIYIGPLEKYVIFMQTNVLFSSLWRLECCAFLQITGVNETDAASAAVCLNLGSIAVAWWSY